MLSSTYHAVPSPELRERWRTELREGSKAGHHILHDGVSKYGIFGTTNFNLTSSKVGKR